MVARISHEGNRALRQYVLYGIWFGSVSGLVEGVLVLLLSKLRLVDLITWVAPSPDIIWISAVFNVIAFTTLSMTMCAARRTYPQAFSEEMAITVLAFVTFFEWIALSFRAELGNYSALNWKQRTPTIAAAVLLSLGLAKTLAPLLRKRRLFGRRQAYSLVVLVSVVLMITEASRLIQEDAAENKLKAASGSLPNIIIIVIDTLRSDHVSTYGYDRKTTPHLDQLAYRGVVFENAFAASSWTLPSHASLLTGQYPHEHGAETKALREDLPTLGEIMQELNYRTGGFSANTFFFSRRVGLDRGFMHFEDYFNNFEDAMSHTFYGRILTWFMEVTSIQDGRPFKRAEDVNRSALRWIDSDRSKPFFMFLNYFDAHAPYSPPERFRRKFSATTSVIGLRNRPAALENKGTQNQIDRYDGAIAYVDDQIGQLISELDKRERLRNTIFVVTSDHGEFFGEHGLMGHRNALYGPVVRVPLIISGSGWIPVGRRISTPVSNVSVAATLLDLLKTSPQPTIHLPSLVPLWSLPAKLEWISPQMELTQTSTLLQSEPAFHGWIKAAVTLNWFCVIHEKYGPELYDLKRDPLTLHALPISDHNDIVQEFRHLLSTTVSE